MVANSREVQIKGTRDGLVIVLNPACDFNELKHSLLRQLERARDFFKGARFTFYQGKKGLPAEQKEELVNIVTGYGLIYAEDIALPTASKPAKHKAVAPGLTAGRLQEEQEKPPVSTALGTASLPQGAGAALLVRHSIRSGQSVTSENHLVVIGDVHPGTTVAAAGSIVVLGSLMGTAAAGLYGNREATVTAHKLAPIALSIAGVAALPPAKPLVDSRAVLSGNRIVYTSLRESTKSNRRIPANPH